MVNKLKVFLSLICIVLLTDAFPSSGKYTPACTGTTYYVSNAGNNANCGNNVNQPWQTIAKVNSFSFPANSTVVFKGGNTFSTTTPITVPQNNFTINSYGSGQATISTGNSSGCITATDFASLTITNIICTGGGPTTNNQNGIIISNDTNTNIIGPSITNTTVSGYGISCVLVNGVAGSGTGGFSNTIVNSNTVHDCSSNAPANTIIFACILVQSPNARVNSQNVTINSNTVFNCQGKNPEGANNSSPLGIWVQGVTGGTVSNNLVHDIGANSTPCGGCGGSEGIIALSSTNLVISFNEIYNVSDLSVDGECLNPGQGAINMIVEYNYVHDCRQGGILTGDFGDRPINGIDIRFNIVAEGPNSSSQRGILIEDLAASTPTTNLRVYNNTIISNQECAKNIAGGKLTLTFANNLCYGQSSTVPTLLFDNSGAGTVINITGNDYWTDSGANQLSISVNNGVTIYNTLAAAQAAGIEKVSGNPVGQAVNPFLSSVPAPTNAPVCGGYNGTCPTAYNLRLASTLVQPAGLNLNTVYGFTVGTQDFYGNAVTASTMPIGAAQGTVALDPATTAWVTAVTNAGGSVGTYQTAITDNLIVGLKADGLFSLLDRLWLFATEDNATESLVDIIADKSATNGGLTWTAKQGYAGDGTHVIDSNFDPTVGSPNFTANSCSNIIWMRAVAASGPGSIAASGGNSQITPFTNFDANSYFQCNDNSFDGAVSLSNPTGLYHASRTSSSTVLAVLNGTLRSTISSTSNGSISAGFTNKMMGNFNAGGGVAAGNSGSIAGFGGGMNATQAGNLYTRLNNYMNAL